MTRQKMKYTIYTRKWVEASYKARKDTAIELATLLLKGNYPMDDTEVRDDTGAVVWSSSQPDTRWRKLRERVTAEIEELRKSLAEGLILQSEAEKFITANETILEWMKELESDGDDGKTD